MRKVTEPVFQASDGKLYKTAYYAARAEAKVQMVQELRDIADKVAAAAIPEGDFFIDIDEHSAIWKEARSEAFHERYSGGAYYSEPRPWAKEVRRRALIILAEFKKGGS